ncbi:hypothetical protein C8A01DRAFT_19707, partial [Parachaetomium inaequale]
QTVFPPWRPGRGGGLFKAETNAVMAPRSHILLEAYMRLCARDHGKHIGSFSVATISYMGLYVEEDGLLDASLLPEPLRTSYRELNEGKKTTLQWLLELKQALRMDEEDSDPDESF